MYTVAIGGFEVVIRTPDFHHHIFILFQELDLSVAFPNTFGDDFKYKVMHIAEGETIAFTCRN
jgi:hypothetical protein